MEVEGRFVWLKTKLKSQEEADNRRLWIYWSPAERSTCPGGGTSVEERVDPTWRVWSERNLIKKDLIEQYHSVIPPVAWELRRDHRQG